jgi:hypothetical protein
MQCFVDSSTYFEIQWSDPIYCRCHYSPNTMTFRFLNSDIITAYNNYIIRKRNYILAQKRQRVFLDNKDNIHDDDYIVFD